MADLEDEQPHEPAERPSTWENVVVGKAKKLAGELLRADDLVDEGEEQEEIAHELHDEARHDDSR